MSTPKAYRVLRWDYDEPCDTEGVVVAINELYDEGYRVVAYQFEDESYTVLVVCDETITESLAWKLCTQEYGE